MTPRQYLALVVEPNLEEAAKDVSNVRLTYNAVMAVDGLAAHVYHWCRRHNASYVQGLKDDTWYREQCGRHRGNVQMLHDMAKASKHVELERGKPTIKTFAEMQPRAFGFGEGGYGVGPYGGGDQVSVMIGDQKVQIALLLLSTVDFYRHEMDAAGIPD